jgi:5-methylcytosine-specific restriction enzyme B
VAEITRLRRGEVLRGVFAVLADEPDGLPVQEVISRVRRLVPPTAFEATEYENTPGVERYDQQLRFHTIGAVKAGWLIKERGVWRLTDEGHSAYRTHPDPEDFAGAVDDGYRRWLKDRDADRKPGPQQWSRLVAALDMLPAGTWTTDADLAAFAGVTDAAIGDFLANVVVPNGHRVLPDDGRVSASIAAQLEADGVDIDGSGHADLAQRVTAEAFQELSGTDDSPVRRAWLVRGSNVQGVNLVRDFWLRSGVCSLPATRLRSLPAGATQEQVKLAVDEDYAHASMHERTRQTAEYYSFLSRMRDGDIVLTNDGSDIYVGVLTGGPAFVSSVGSRANLQRNVEWRNAGEPFDYGRDLPDEISARLSNPDADVIELTEFIGDLEQLLGEEPAPALLSRKLRLPDATEELAAELLVGQDWLQECVELVRDKPQLIFYGPPGTGKTFLAQRLARHLTGGKPENVQLVQFHPAYSYEDFFEGYRPGKTTAGAVTFDLTPGPLRRLADAARAHPEEPHVLIIDEINRGNLAKVFGELYFLLEYRGLAVPLLYGSDEGKGFSLPRNLIILATMNSADRSIALVDTAMRRRFSFCELHPDQPPTRDLLMNWLTRERYPNDAALLLAELNARIDDRDFRIGPSYLMNAAAQSPAGLDRIWRTQLMPLLEEHHYGDLSHAQVVDKYGLAALRPQLGLPEPGPAQPGAGSPTE